jgi:hypothetical protein
MTESNLCLSESTPLVEYLFDNKALEWCWVAFITTIFIITMGVIVLRWHEPDLKPRSPMLILFLLAFLLIDVVGNTVLFSINPVEYPQVVCWLGIFITVICEFGIMLVLYLRMYRINKVFTEYETYLHTQKEAILDNASVLSTTPPRSPKPLLGSLSNQTPIVKSKHSSEQIYLQNKLFSERLRRNSENLGRDENNSDRNSFISSSERVVSGLIDSGVGLESISTFDELNGVQWDEAHTNDSEMRERLKKLQEWNLMRAGIIWFLIPSLLLGVLSLFFPYIYAIIPAHESGACICHL